jgi:hypothetical protein
MAHSGRNALGQQEGREPVAKIVEADRSKAVVHEMASQALRDVRRQQRTSPSVSEHQVAVRLVPLGCSEACPGLPLPLTVARHSGNRHDPSRPPGLGRQHVEATSLLVLEHPFDAYGAGL